jgi:hypothetical protein
VDFRLIYQGRLPAEGRSDTRAADKHRIRQAFHPQLRELWNQHPQLKAYQKKPDWSKIGSQMEQRAENFSRCGYRFVPLVTWEEDIACSLDILFLRRDSPGNLVRSGGDIDNRIKVLFDALRMPDGCKELAGNAPGEGEDPFFCLLENDSMITGVNVATDRLLRPVADAEAIHHVMLIIQVKVFPTNPLIGNPRLPKGTFLTRSSIPRTSANAKSSGGADLATEEK